MTTLHIPVSGHLETFVQSAAKAGGYRSPADFVQHLLKEEERRCAGEKFAAMIQEGIDSGFVDADDAFWDKMGQEVETAIQNRKKK